MSHAMEFIIFVCCFVAGFLTSSRGTKLPVPHALYAAAVREAETWRSEYHMMQRAYFDLARPREEKAITPVVLPVAAREPSIVADAVREESGGDPKLAAYFWKRVRELRADKIADADIVAELGKWQTTESTESFI